MSPATIRARRKAMEGDVWLFYRWIWAPCMPKDRAVERFHRPLMYIMDGDADRLAWCLDNPVRFHGKLMDDIRAECRRRKIDWHTPRGIRKLRVLLTKINNRMARAFGKTTHALCVMHKMASVNPSDSFAIASKSDQAAWDFCQIIGNVMKEVPYATYFPDRLFRQASGAFDYSDKHISMKFIDFNGRRNPAQHTIEARGLRAQWNRKHYNYILGDDISGTEAGDASVEQALKWQANLDAISMPPEHGRTRILLNGTKQGGNDDMAVAASDPAYFTIRMPIWQKNVPSTLKNVWEDGVPVLPEFTGIEDIRAFRQSAKSNPQQGLVWFMRNYELSDELGMLHFTEDLLRQQTFLWVEKLVRRKNTAEVFVRRYIRRYRWTPKGSPLLGENPANKTGTCDCWMGCGDPKHLYVEFDPLALPRILGVDQAVSKHGDPWGIACMAIDPEGYLYWLKGEMGQGYEAMIPTVVVVFDRWGGLAYPPRKIGIETGAAQSITVYWMQQGGIYGDLSQRIEGVPPGALHKKIRMFNNILTPMLHGRLYLDPDDKPRNDEMLKWDNTALNPTDGLLDAGGIAAFLHETRARDPKADYTEFMSAEMTARRGIDPETQIDMSSDIVDQAFGAMMDMGELSDLFGSPWMEDFFVEAD